jgi:hypothetical protein
MPRTRHILNALRVAASWLLVMCVLVGPAVLGGSVASATSAEACGPACPCDDGDVDDAGRDEGGPCQDNCPDDCPNCACGVGVAMALLPLPVLSRAMSRASTRMIAPVDAPTKSTGGGVFRPPRAA